MDNYFADPHLLLTVVCMYVPCHLVHPRFKASAGSIECVPEPEDATEQGLCKIFTCISVGSEPQERGIQGHMIAVEQCCQFRQLPVLYPLHYFFISKFCYCLQVKLNVLCIEYCKKGKRLQRIG